MSSARRGTTRLGTCVALGVMPAGTIAVREDGR